MNTISRSFLISCLWSITVYTSPVKILEKNIDLGKDPKTQKSLTVKAYAFTEGQLSATADTLWVAVFADGKDIVFLYAQNGSKIKLLSFQSQSLLPLNRHLTPKLIQQQKILSLIHKNLKLQATKPRWESCA